MTGAIATPASTSRSPLQSSSLPEETITSIPSSATEFDGSDGNIKHYHHNNYALKPLKQALDPVVCQKASRYASRVHEEMSKRSTLLAEEAKVLTIDRNDVMPYIGELLGKGGFNSVYELNLPKEANAVNATGTSSTGDANTRDGGSSALLQLVQTTSTQQLAIKFLSDSSMTVSEEFCNGAADLLMEAKYLCALSANHAHAHLIRIHAVCRAGAAGFSLADRAGYFIVIDRLVDTLDRRMDVWAELLKRNLGNVKRAKALYLQRLLICVDIASALKHLHQVKLLFRDLKPDNVGFDHNGQVKLFDFGLAKELDPKQKNGNNLYLMSGGTGSRRFMAPEVALSEPYSLSADVYSFAILLWEVLTLRKAFAHMPVEEHRDKVIRNNERPEMDASWSDELQALLRRSWKRNPMDRPESKEVHRILKKECQTIYVEEFASK